MQAVVHHRKEPAQMHDRHTFTERTLTLGAFTDRGVRYKTLGRVNEDAFRIRSYHEDTAVLMIVVDGMGGESHGDIAGRTAADVSFQALERIMKTYRKISDEVLMGVLERAVKAAHEAVMAKVRNNKAYRGMGTTLTIALIRDGKVFAAHVGDSKIYIINQREIKQITKDHDLAAELTAIGINPEGGASSRLTRAIGAQNHTPDISVHWLKKGDFVLVCSDGLENSNVLESDIKRIVIGNGNETMRAAKVLVGLGNRRGGKDNLTVTIARYNGPEHLEMRNAIGHGLRRNDVSHGNAQQLSI